MPKTATREVNNDPCRPLNVPRYHGQKALHSIAYIEGETYLESLSRWAKSAPANVLPIFSVNHHLKPGETKTIYA
ncbi:hypothetical protein LZ518_08450 [Sphingomonas sp. RB56-2]|uniref:Uncharacterized protein n=1 Tax=Sphingomonas brevis TaxID=2908206 RepID=A0ABT0S9U7_9SPHN|nr:hypothetical protein [Sphingomonas brevis]MCL6741159.1 hypothetical protein [Sphingomonas brevis]